MLRRWKKVLCVCFFAFLGAGMVTSESPNVEEYFHVCLMGLNDAGKTANFNSLLGRNFTETRPTIGFDVSDVKYKDVVFAFWDLGGQCKIKGLWRHYLGDTTHAIVFVIDAAAGMERLKVASRAMHEMFQKAIIPKELFVLILANKQDLEGKLSSAEIIDGLNLLELKNEWDLLETSAKDYVGISQILDSLYQKLNKNK
ncbi:uncharacterized protein LOC128859114 [Anastrepha ludens]|uniref:uncharacterized protein LOC128859114 n=1 Tax=Anastrepha ludens TaxID=28586 RepID=UPI0023AEE5BE|nr:uncharacterized protein LOC128859114 [Anastrepha ludens]